MRNQISAYDKKTVDREATECKLTAREARQRLSVFVAGTQRITVGKDHKRCEQKSEKVEIVLANFLDHLIAQNVFSRCV